MSNELHVAVFVAAGARLAARSWAGRIVRDRLRWVLLAICCSPAICDAAPPPLRSVRVPLVDRADIRFAHVSLETAPAGVAIVRIAQDDQGFLWFGTSRGLLRYDGYQFRAFVHDPANPNSISGVNVGALIKDRAGNLWVGSDEQLDRYDPVSGVFNHFFVEKDNPCWPIGHVRDIAQDREGLIWLATNDGLKRLNPATSTLTCYQHRQADPSSIASNSVGTMLQSRDGDFWVASNPGLDRLDLRTKRVAQRVTLRGPSGKDLSLDGTKVTLIEDHAGIVWIAIPGGQESSIVSFDPRTGIQTAYEFGPSVAIPPVLIEDGDQSLWFAHWQYGVIKLDRERKHAIRYHTNPSDPNSVTKGGIYALLADRKHRIWIGTIEGRVDRFDPRTSSFQSYRHDPGDPNSLTEGAVTAVLKDSRGAVWVGGGAGGLDRFDREAGRVTRYNALPASIRSLFRYVMDIAEDHAGQIWVADWGHGLARFDPRTGAFKFYRHERDDPGSLSSDLAKSVFVDHGGTLWIGTSDGLNRFDPVTDRFHAFRNAVARSNSYGAIAEDSSGALWLGSAPTPEGTGLRRFDPETGRFTVFRNSPSDPLSLSNDNVNSVYVDREGVVWAGTDNGLNRFNQSRGTFTSYYARDGLPTNWVASILQDNRGYLWLSTSNGICRFNPHTRTFQNYFDADGLPGNQYQFAAFKSTSGELFFGATEGVLAFYPEHVRDDTSPSPVVLTDFLLFGDRSRGSGLLKQSIPFTRSLTLTPSQNVFSFEFSTLSYSNPSQDRYRYRLEGLEKEWNETDSARRVATYTTLPPRDYVFRVQGRNSRGVWNESGVSVHIRILPPLWGTWWFRTLTGAIVSLSFWGFLQLRLRQQAREFNVRFEERLGERTRIARELHDTLLQSFHGLLLRFQAAHNLLPARADDARHVLEAAIDNAAQAITEARDAVQDLRSSTTVTNDLAKAIEVLGGELMAHQRATGGDTTEFAVQVEGTPLNFNPILRDEIYRIAGEALRNAFRHARARRIEVEIRYAERHFSVRVRDDGIGIDASVLSQEGRPGHFGLQGIRERSKSIGGQLEVWSEHGAGTEMELIIPATIAHGDRVGRRLRLFKSKMGAN